MPSLSKTEDVEAKYDVALNFPNLELHSAAASGNVGLVHYALTHGQPVNSVLHGVLPLHAACSGGNVSVVRMLIERGADVNAPRLPRRYSDGRKADAPSVGAAGSTPLHFAAANGHAPIVQILLTCGATPDKSDKNGMTPEALAEVNGHTDVIRVLRVWEHLKLQELQSRHSSAGATNTEPELLSDNGDPDSPSASTSQLGLDDERERYGYLGSRKGKERAMSVSSNVSDALSNRSRTLKLKSSLEKSHKGRGSRSVSANSEGRRGDASPRSDEPDLQVRLSRLSNETDHDTIISPVEVTTPTSPNIYNEPDVARERAFSGTSVSSMGLGRPPSAASGGSGPPGIVVSQPAPPMNIGPPPTRRKMSVSSRRPSLPSIFERAAHPAATFRAAIRRDNEARSRISPDPAISPTEETSPRSGGSGGSGGSFFGGRNKANDASARQAASRKYMSKQGLVQLFRRGQSPPSRSPSPPERSDPGKVIGAEELDEGIERLKRASIDLEMRESQENPTEAMKEGEEKPSASPELRQPEPRPPPASAPATQTRFFEDLDTPPVSFLNLSAYPFRREDQTASPLGSDRARNRPRTTSEVIAPSPLAKEFSHDEDSDSPPRRTKRRVNTGGQQGSLSSGTSGPPTPQPTIISNPRLATVRTAPPLGAVWDGALDLRKLALGDFSRGSETQPAFVEDGDLDDGDDEEFHDALPDVGEPELVEVAEVQPVEQAPARSQLPETMPAGGRALDTERRSGPEGLEAEGPASLDTPLKATEDEGIESAEQQVTAVVVPVEQEPLKSPIRAPGRYRGASVGSMTSNSSRISAASLRMSLITDEGSSDRGSQAYGQIRSAFESKKMSPPPPPPSTISVDGRSRGISVSSTTSTSTSGMGFSYMQSTSTPGTSLTPPSTLSLHLTGGFPPVPEDEVAPHPVPRRKVSSRAEAANIVKQNEDDILQLAQMPPSLNSSRSLAAQLAAYGENHAIEQEFAEREAQGTGDGDVDSSDNPSFFSAGESAMSGMSSIRSSERPSHYTGGRKTRPPPKLLSVDAPPKSSVPSINSIYDRRAAAYRDRMIALTNLPPIVPPSRSRSRARASTPSESWLNAGPDQHRSSDSIMEETDRHPNISGPMHVSSSTINVSSRGRKPQSVRSTSSRQPSFNQFAMPSTTSISRSLSPMVSSRFDSQPHPHSPRTAPAPIADVVSARFQGFSAPPPIQSASSPHISIFSNRYSGSPRDGGDSDDEEDAPRLYTVVENDWRGGHVVRPDPDAFKKGGKWGQLKGAIGHIGRR